MRVSNFSRFNYDVSSQKDTIARIQKEISQDGISYEGKEGVRNTQIKLSHDDNTAMLTSQIKSLYSIQNNMNIYDSNLQSINSSLDKFRELMIQKENSTLSIEGINAITAEQSSIIDFVKSLEEQKLNSYEYLYNTNGQDTELVIGDNHRMTRSFSDDLIKTNGVLNSELLEELSVSNFIDGLDNLKKSVDKSLIEVGIVSNNSQRQIDLKELYKAYDDKYLNSLGSIEEKITEMNSAINAYESQMLMISKVQGLSLVNYL